MEKPRNTDLRTEEVRDILKRMPHWTIRWGTTVVAAIIVLVLFFSYLFRYPDLIRAEVVVSANNPPAVIKARSTGKITGIFMDNEQFVSTGQVLAVIENAANLNDVQSVETFLAGMNSFLGDFDFSTLPELPSLSALGPVQEPYSAFEKQLTDYRNFVDQQFYNKRIAAIDGQMAMQQKYWESLDEGRKIENQRYNLANLSFKRDSALFLKKTISENEYEKSLSDFLAQKKVLEDILSEQATTRAGIYELQLDKATLQQENDTRTKEFKTSIAKAFGVLNSAIESWKLAYVLVSPIAGKASFNKVWALNQNITEGETLVTIVPNEPSEVIGKAFIPVKGAGKVKRGQRVNIKLNNYPYMEYGMLIGEVRQKAPVPVNDSYAVEITLSQELKTNYGQTLEMQQELSGSCEIITDDLRLIERIVFPIKAIIEKNRR